jgi:hypothetical protein
MVAHQHPGVNAPASHGARLAQHFEEQLPVRIAPENRFPPIPPRHDVIEGTGILYANAAWHRAPLLSDDLRCQDLLPDPYSYSRCFHADLPDTSRGKRPPQTPPVLCEPSPPSNRHRVTMQEKGLTPIFLFSLASAKAAGRHTAKR